MQDPAFAAPGQFYRGNLHTHSNLSDGRLEPEEVCRRYKAEGYDFLVLSDHFVGRYNYPITDTIPFRGQAFTTLLGAELHSGAQGNGDIWHLLAVGLPKDFTPPNAPDFMPVDNQENAGELARRAAESGAYVVMAHPHWSGLTVNDAQAIEAAHAIEIYNHTCAVGADRGDGLYLADLLANEGRQLSFCANDDAHFEFLDAFGGWVMVKAEENSPQALLTSLKSGLNYSSQGPEIKDIIWTDDYVEVHSSAVQTVIVQGFKSRADHVVGSAITRAQVPFKKVKRSPWLRITIIDAYGRRAWSNPFWR